MNITRKKINKKNVTQKNRKPYIPFEQNYMDKLAKNKKYKGLKQENFKLLRDLYTKNDGIKTNPKNDFYSFVNEKWIKNKDLYNIDLTQKQKYIAQIDDFRLVQDNVYNQLDNIIKDYIKNNKNKTAKCMKNYYDSFIKTLTKEMAKKYLDETIQFIDEMRKDKNNLWKLIAEINKNESIKSKSPFIWNLVTNRKNSKYFISEISPHEFALIDDKGYYEDNEEKRIFLKYLREIFEISESGIKDYENVFNCSTKLFKLFECKEFKNDPNNYNLVTADEALEKYNFDWKTFAKELGYKNVPNKFVVTNINYLSCCCKLLIENWYSEEWRSWWIWIFLRRIVSLTKDWRNVFFEYYAKKQRGIENVDTSIAREVIYTSLPFNTTLSIEYIKKYNNKFKVEYIKGFIEDLKLVFIRIIENNSWMSPSTKKYALKKLRNLTFQLVSPDYLFPDVLLDYTNDDIYANINKLFNYRTKLFISLDGKKTRHIPEINWDEFPPKLTGFQCYLVNAMYIPTLNSIYIPLGYLQKPFIDLDNRGIEYNLSNIGFTICHEMSHCLDDIGSKYDYQGNLRNWWTPSDKAKYKKIQDDILRQYKEWTKRDGLNFNPTYSLDEDIADISGLYICDIYLLDFMKNNKALTPVIGNAMNTFHIYFAAQQKQKIQKNAKKAQMLLNPHPPNKYRCNIPISRSLSYVGNYDIKKSDKMWWHNITPIW